MITKNENHRKRMVIDYSQTINRFTELDAYPFPDLDEMVSEIATYHVFSALDLKSAYHQIILQDCDKKYTAFEANGQLYQSRVLSFGLTNAVACFQRLMDNLIRDNNLKGTYAYLDNITICGETQEEHDRNLKAFRSGKTCQFNFQ